MKRLLLFSLCLLLCTQAAFAQDLSITFPRRAGFNPVDVPPITTYRWQTVADSPDPAEVRWILEPLSSHNGNWLETMEYIRNNPDSPGWHPWRTYDPPGVGTSWTTPPTDGGFYVFAVHGKDSDGNASTVFDEDFNLRRIRVREGAVPIEENTWSQIKALFR
jgi:hypothetical protein